MVILIAGLGVSGQSALRGAKIYTDLLTQEIDRANKVFQESNANKLNIKKINATKLSVKNPHRTSQDPFKIITYDQDKNKKPDFTDLEQLKQKINLNDLEFCVISPGIKPTSEIVQLLQKHQVSIISETELAWKIAKLCNIKKIWIGITGTNGKTTTTTLTTKIIKNAAAVGNIGSSVIDAVLDEKVQVLVIEISSFVLHWASDDFSLDVACLTNLAPDHQNWHKSFDEYKSDKLKVFNNCKYAVIDPSLTKEIADLLPNYAPIKQAPKLSDQETNLIENLTYVKRIWGINKAMLTDLTYAVKLAKCAEVLGAHFEINELNKYKTERYRLDDTRLPFINDSKSTNIHSILAALENFPNNSVILLLGGETKNIDFTNLGQQIKEKVLYAIITNPNNKTIIESLASAKIPYKIATGSDNLASGIDILRSAITAGYEIWQGLPNNVTKYILFSPGAASFDYWQSYRQRGEYFDQIVQDLTLKKDDENISHTKNDMAHNANSMQPNSDNASLDKNNSH